MRMDHGDAIIELIERIRHLEGRVAELEASRKVRRKRRAPSVRLAAPGEPRKSNGAAWSEGKLAGATFVGAVVAKVLSGHVGDLTAREICERVGLDGDRPTLICVRIACQRWGLREKKSGARRSFVFDGRVLE